MSIVGAYRGRITFHELANSEMRLISTLRYLSYKESLDPDSKDAKVMEAIEDELS